VYRRADRISEGNFVTCPHQLKPSDILISGHDTQDFYTVRVKAMKYYVSSNDIRPHALAELRLSLTDRWILGNQ
jgi:hypothetical protein